MSHKIRGTHGIWKGRWTFILAATGSAVGLGNIWKFPYITGEYGGSAFVLAYLLCILIIGIPVMMSEIMLGRDGRMSPIKTMQTLTHKYSSPRFFAAMGWIGAVSGFLILSFYSVVAGWALVYVGKMASGMFVSADAAFAGAALGGLHASPVTQLIAHTVFMLMTGVVVALGVHKGLERSIRFLMPTLFIMLIALFVYSLTTPGFEQSWNYLFSFTIERINSEALIAALGHAFFTLSIGMGAIMAYGAYLPDKAHIGKTVLIAATLDTVIALMAGVVIFSVVFSYGLAPTAGPGLLFESLPIAFGSLPGGVFIGTAFFVLVAIASWTSAISMAEPAVAWAVDKGYSRIVSTTVVCLVAWTLGIGTVLSFNAWADNKFFGMTVFENIDFITANILMPLGGLMLAVFVGWFMSKEAVAKQMRIRSERVFAIWRFVLRYLSPLAIFAVFIYGLTN